MSVQPQLIIDASYFAAAFLFIFALASYWWAIAYGTKVWLSAALLFAAVALAGLGNLFIVPIGTRLFL